MVLDGANSTAGNFADGAFAFNIFSDAGGTTPVAGDGETVTITLLDATGGSPVAGAPVITIPAPSGTGPFFVNNVDFTPWSSGGFVAATTPADVAANGGTTNTYPVSVAVTGSAATPVPVDASTSLP